MIIVRLAASMDWRERLRWPQASFASASCLRHTSSSISAKAWPRSHKLSTATLSSIAVIVDDTYNTYVRLNRQTSRHRNALAAKNKRDAVPTTHLVGQFLPRILGNMISQLPPDIRVSALQTYGFTVAVLAFGAAVPLFMLWVMNRNPPSKE